jgi:hypothetical protein
VIDSLRTLWSVGMTEGALALALLSLPRSALHRARIPIWTLGVSYLAFLNHQTLYMARNLLHVLPALIALSAVGFVRLQSWAARAGAAASPARQPGRRRWIGAVLALAVLAPVAARAGWQARALGVRDTRLLARDWIAAHAPPGARVAECSEKTPVPLRGLRVKSARFRHPNLRKLKKKGYRYVVYADTVDMRYTRLPERYPEQVKSISEWMTQMNGGAKLVARFKRRTLPGWNQPGSTANIYHQPNVWIWQIQ